MSKPRTRDGYVTVGIDGVRYRAHRLAWVMTDNLDKAFQAFTIAYEAFRKENPPKPEKRTVKVWINCYDPGWAFFAKDRQQADNAAKIQQGDRIACIEREITYTTGEGLEP